MSWKHDDLAADLADHIRQKTGRIVWTDMQLGPSGSPRPDAYSIEPSYTKFRPLAYEVKVSVADFRRDVTAGKWQTYLPFSAGVIFAVPAGLIDKAVLPEGCGLMVRGPDGWRTAKAPTLRAIETLPHAAWVKLFIDGMTREVNRRAAEIRPGITGEWQARNLIGRKLGSEVAQVLNDRLHAETRYQGETERLRKATEGLSEEVRQQQEYLLERSRREASKIDASRAELAMALGLPADASIRAIQSAAINQAQRLNRDEEVARLRRSLNTVRSALDGALSTVSLAQKTSPASVAADPGPVITTL